MTWCPIYLSGLNGHGSAFSNPHPSVVLIHQATCISLKERNHQHTVSSMQRI